MVPANARDVLGHCMSHRPCSEWGSKAWGQLASPFAPPRRQWPPIVSISDRSQAFRYAGVIGQRAGQL